MIRRLFLLLKLLKVGILSSFFFGVVYTRGLVLLLRYFYVAGLVAEVGPWSGVGSSTDGAVFVCEAAMETPAQESDIASFLPDDSSRHTRTQHGRAAVGVEPSVIHNEWERGMFPCSCFFLLCDLSSISAFKCVVAWLFFSSAV